ncbi:lysophospholipid acyltransferase family protein [Methyloterricola oryzae]|uniref:lysophospholipid acyltransferase family protein n=1 Tax=Methyloterricola oryzae TaxID=1495050 RepID=UPI0005EBB4F7|nr:lysophospholipid acyltransferase family protein [Methyloterricola oryzae]
MKPSNTSSTPGVDLGLYLRSGVYFTGMILSTLVICPLMLLAYAAPFELRYGLAQRWVRFNLWSLKLICRLDYQVEGMEHIPERNGVILCKHQSAWETIALQAIFPPLTFILKKELLNIPFWGWAMRTQEPIAIDRSARSAALKQVLKDGAARLASGRWVVIFPEGTRVAPGQRGKYNGSGATLAHRAGCPVVPVAHNAGEFWGRRAFLKHPGTIQVRIGPPLDAASLPAAEVNRVAEDWIEAQMTALSSPRPD